MNRQNSSASATGKGAPPVSLLVKIMIIRFKRMRERNAWRRPIREPPAEDTEKMEDIYFHEDDVAPPPESFAGHPRRDAQLRKKFRRRTSKVSRANYFAAQNIVNNSVDTDFPYLHEWRWEAVTGVARASVVGKGDLVFTDGNGRFAVVKLGVTTSPSDNDAARGRQSKAQALRYARIYERMNPHATAVLPMLMTNDGLLIYKDGEWSGVKGESFLGWRSLYNLKYE